ncbi:MAG: SH3 domain-containing protein [Desulforegulaceae bacterium]|nr:SH3 domain-containing protein [Desulforegulaceae bacterium]
MERIKIPIILFVQILILFSVQCFAGERVSVESDRLNVRSGPGSTYEVLWQAEKNYPLEVIEEKGHWVHFKDFEGYEGWVYKPLLGKKKTVVIKVYKANVRKGPGTDYPIVFTAEKGTPFELIGTKNNWYEIRHSDGDSGWVSSSLLW